MSLNGKFALVTGGGASLMNAEVPSEIQLPALPAEAA